MLDWRVFARLCTQVYTGIKTLTSDEEDEDGRLSTFWKVWA